MQIRLKSKILKKSEKLNTKMHSTSIGFLKKSVDNYDEDENAH